MAASVWAGAMVAASGAPRAASASKPPFGVKYNFNICVGATGCIFDFSFSLFAALCEKKAYITMVKYGLSEHHGTYMAELLVLH